ncbi:MAG: protease modulator HflC [Hellea sp.]|nr:protease modulator HflC [Hellea sp.]
MKFKAIYGIIAFVIFAIIWACVFTVKEWEQGLVLEFGKAKRVENEWGKPSDAGLKFKAPWESVVKLDRRNLEIDLKPVELLASDQERLVVDAFVRYRILNGIKYYEALRDEAGAEQKLNSIMDSTLRDVLGRVDTPEIIAGRRAELMAEIQDVSNQVAANQDLGVEIIDVRIKRADLPRENAERVFARMVTQREQEASLKRAQGQERAQEIRATAEKEATVIKAKAREQSEIIRGQGDKQRNAIYAEAYEQDADFFEFYRSMEAYKKSLKEGTTYIMSPDSEFLEFLNRQSGGRR